MLPGDDVGVPQAGSTRVYALALAMRGIAVVLGARFQPDAVAKAQVTAFRLRNASACHAPESITSFSAATASHASVKPT